MRTEKHLEFSTKMLNTKSPKVGYISSDVSGMFSCNELAIQIFTVFPVGDNLIGHCEEQSLILFVH
jgi:hypothetical protein